MDNRLQLIIGGLAAVALLAAIGSTGLFVIGLGAGAVGIALFKGKFKMPTLGREKHLVKKKHIKDKEVLAVVKEFAPHLLDSKDRLKVKVDHIIVEGVKYSLENI